MTTVTANTAGDECLDLLHRARDHQERVVVEESGRPAGALISVEDLELLEALEDPRGLADLREAKAETESFSTIADVKARLEARRVK